MNYQDEILAFLKEKTGKESLSAEERIFSGGLLDSFGVLELIAFLEEKFCVEIDTAKYEIKDFDTLNLIVELVTKIKSN